MENIFRKNDIEVIEQRIDRIRTRRLIVVLHDPIANRIIQPDIELQLPLHTFHEVLPLRRNIGRRRRSIKRIELHRIKDVIEKVRAEGILHSRRTLRRQKHKIEAFRRKMIDRILHKTRLIFNEYALVQNIAL